MESISRSEEKYIVAGIRQGIRSDGRGRMDYRQISIESGVIPQANGSARVSLLNGSTDILAAVKVEVGEPTKDKPKEGRIEVNVELCPSVSSKAVGREASEMNAEYTQMLTRLLRSSKESLSFESLCIIPGQKVWVLYLDIMVLDSGGNLADCMSIAAYAALNNTLLPKVRTIETEEGDPVIEVEEDLLLSNRFQASSFPICITLSQVGGAPFIADATQEEELCVGVKVVVSIDPEGNVCGIQKSGYAGISFPVMESLLNSATVIARTMFEKLGKALQEEQRKEDGAEYVTEKLGFLGL